MREVFATKSEALALAEESRLLRDGYRFLDEKRMLLAGEMLRQLRHYDRLSSELEQARATALAAFGGALQRHGLDELQAHRAAAAQFEPPATVKSSFLGVDLLRLADAVPARPPAIDTGRLNLSPEVRAAEAAFALLAGLACEAGVTAGNLTRLAREFRRTERRAKALENVLLPELDAVLKRVTEQLDSLDQEEAVRVRSLLGAPRR